MEFNSLKFSVLVSLAKLIASYEIQYNIYDTSKILSDLLVKVF